VLKLLVLVVAICVTVYVVVRVIDRRGLSSKRTMSPDDDPDFLREFDRRRREERCRRQHDTTGEPGEPGPQTDDG
jgi:hypothetical protein